MTRGHPERYCRKAHHDTLAVGRHKSGECKRCAYIRVRATRAKSAYPHIPLLPPAGPLDEVLRYEALRLAEDGASNGLGLQMLARRFADRYGGTADQAARFLHRLPHQQYVTKHMADRWLTLIGSHLDLVYGEEVA